MTHTAETTHASIIMSSLSTRIKLFREDPHCFWCGCLTTLDVTNPRLATLATVDHLYSRQHPARSRRKHMKVLACFNCNQRRNNCECKGIYFMPKLPERVAIARDTCATLGRAILAQNNNQPSVRENRKSSIATLRAVSPAVVLTLEEEYRREVKRKQPMRVIQTLQEAVEFARENPAR